MASAQHDPLTVNPDLPVAEEEASWFSGWSDLLPSLWSDGETVATSGRSTAQAGEIVGSSEDRSAAVLDARATPGTSVVSGTGTGFDRRAVDSDWARNDIAYRGPETEVRIPGTDSFAATSGAMELAPGTEAFVTSDGFEVVPNETGKQAVIKDGVPIENWREHFGDGLKGVSDENLEHAFGVAMRDHMFQRLDAAEAGVQAQVLDPEAATRAAESLRAAEARYDAARTSVPTTTVAGRGIDKTQVVRNTGVGREVRESYEREREAIIATYPLLRGMDDTQLDALTSGDEERRSDAIHSEQLDVLADIDATRDHLRDGSVDLWSNESAVTGALDGLGFAQDDPRRQKLLQTHQDAKWWDKGTSVGLAGAGVALSLLGIVEPGPIGETAGAGLIAAGAGVGALDAALESDRYVTDRAAHGAGGGSADFGKVVDDKSMRGRELMLALAWGGLAFDAMDAGRAAHLLAEGSDLARVSKVLGVPEAELAQNLDRARSAYTRSDAVAAKDRHLGDLPDEQRSRIDVGVVPAQGDILSGNRAAFEMFDGHGHVLLREDATLADEISEFAHAKDFVEGKHADDFAKLDDARLQDFPNATPAEKVDLHGARIRIEESGQERALDELTAAFARCSDPDEALHLENAIADTSRSLEAIRKQKAELEAAQKGGDLPDFIESTPTLHRTHPEATRFDDLSREAREANVTRVTEAFKDKPATDASREALLKEGYVERTLPDGSRILARPSGATDALPPLREVNGQWVVGPHVKRYDPLKAGASAAEGHDYLKQSESWRAFEDGLVEMKMQDPTRTKALEGLQGDELHARRAELEQAARAEVDQEVQAKLAGSKHYEGGASGRDVGMDALRHDMKQGFKEEILAHLDALAASGPEGVAKSHQELLAITKKMNPSDMGNLTEDWYRDVFLRLPRDEAGNPIGWSKHVEMPKVGDTDRFADVMTADAIHEVKSGKALTDKDFEQFEEYLANARGDEIGPSRLHYAITDPSTMEHSADRLLAMFRRDPRGDHLQVTLFGVGGKPTVISDLKSLRLHLQEAGRASGSSGI